MSLTVGSSFSTTPYTPIILQSTSGPSWNYWNLKESRARELNLWKSRSTTSTTTVPVAYCGGGIYCYAPHTCCARIKACCLYRSVYTEGVDPTLHHGSHFRPHIWSMWYFWLLIIFMMMSGFGGCGYYRRRRLAMQRLSSTSFLRSSTILEPFQRRFQSRSPDLSSQPTSFATVRPADSFQEPVSHSPPLYSEVITQPHLFPEHKIELPPYAGSFPVTTLSGPHMVTSQDLPLPPPYSDCTYNYPHPYPQPAANQQTPLPTSSEMRVEQTASAAEVLKPPESNSGQEPCRPKPGSYFN